MKSKVVKLLRCPECNKLKTRVEVPEKKAPPCPLCGSKRAYYSDNWHIVFSLPSGKQVLKSVSPFKDQATAKLQEVKTEILEDRYEPFKKALTWEEAKKLVWKYMETAGKRPGTLNYYKHKLAAISLYMPQIAPTMDKIDTDTLIKIRNFRKGQVTPNTINKEIAVIEHCRKLLSDRHILREVEGKKIPWLQPRQLSSPLEELEEILPPEVIWTPDEIEKLLGATDDTYAHAYILLACLGGLRKRTCIEFRREWINWQQNRLEIPPEGRKRGKGTVHYVAMADALVLALKKVWVGYRPYDYEAHKFYKEHKNSYYSLAPKPEPFVKGYLFCHPEDPEKMWSGFESIWVRLKIKIGIFKRFHDLKHTAGTLFQWATKDFKATMDFLDESTLTMTARYIRSSNDIREENMQKFQELFRRKMEDKVPPPVVSRPIF